MPRPYIEPHGKIKKELNQKRRMSLDKKRQQYRNRKESKNAAN